VIALLKNKIVILAIMVVVILLAVCFGPLMLTLLGDEDYNTGFEPADINYLNTYPGSWNLDPLTGIVTKSMGVAGCEIPFICSGDRWYGNIEEGYTELHTDLANQPIVTAYRDDPNILSETITLFGQVSSRVGINGPLSGMYAWRPAKGWYRVRINEGMGWNIIIDSSGIKEEYVEWVYGTSGEHSYSWASWFETESVQEMEPISFKLKGRHVGILEVKQRTRFTDSIGRAETHTTSTDFIYLVSGSGEISVQGTEPVFEVGEDVPIWVSCDYSGQTGSGSGQWELRWYPGDINHPLSGGTITTFDDWTRGTYHWTIPAGAWHRDYEPTIRLELWNTLFPQDAVWIDTIDLKANAPPTPTISVGDRNIEWYQPITVSGSCYTNENTNEPIEYFRIRAKYTDQWQDLGEWQVTPDGQDPSGYSQTIPGSLIKRTGTIEITVKAIDEANRPSLEPAIIQVTVHLPGEPPVGDELIAMIVAAIIIIISVLIAFFAPIPYGWYGKIVVIVIGVIVAILVYIYVDFMPVLDWWESRTRWF